MKSTQAIRCKCGAFEAALLYPKRGTRAVCYCRDCQAFAHFLGLPDGMLDGAGGTDIVAVSPRTVQFVRGVENLACMSLSRNGTLRWYTSCCHTPVGNTPRDTRLSHLGLVHTCMDFSGVSMDDSFGPVRMYVNGKSATGKPGRSSRVGFFAAILRYLGAVAWSRLSGGYRVNPFFTSSGRPRVEPRVLSHGERASLVDVVRAQGHGDALPQSPQTPDVHHPG
ncbi:MAG: hypothetical protein JWR22_2029 [Herminiimonas sp.]|nr:hypothetical protein [Herminiimonas sp.]